MSKKVLKNQLQSDIAGMMASEYGVVDMGTTGVISMHEVVPEFKTPKLETLAPALIERIMKNLANQGDYVEGNMQDRLSYDPVSYGLAQKRMTQNVWRMSGLCSNFKVFMDELPDSLLNSFPRPPIGLRIVPKPLKEGEVEEFKVILYIYGYFSKNNYALCVKPDEISGKIYPAVITTNLTIQGFVLDDCLVEILKGIDTSQVEEVYFNDIRGIDLQEYTVKDVVNLFPNAVIVRFLGDERCVEAEKLDDNIVDMEMESLENIPHGNLISMYHDIHEKKCTKQNPNKTKLNRGRNRLVRETEVLGNVQKAKKKKREPYGKSINRLVSFLNGTPKQKSKEEDITFKIDELEKELAKLRANNA